MEQTEFVTEDTIKNWNETIEREEQKRNTITLQEFEPFFPIYNEKMLADIDPVRLEKTVWLFRRRFNMYKTITVTDSLGKILFEIPPSFVSSKLWNETTQGDESLGAKYLSALETKSPVNPSDLIVLKEMVNAIQNSKSKENIIEYFQERLRIENSYKEVYGLSTDNKQEEVSEEEKTSERLTINTDDLF